MQKGEDKSVFAFTWLDEPNACPGCSWQGKAFEVAERSKVGALESLASNLVRLAALVALDIMKTTAQLLSSRFHYIFAYSLIAYSPHSL